LTPKNFPNRMNVIHIPACHWQSDGGTGQPEGGQG
jgi:hypothetical protein